MKNLTIQGHNEMSTDIERSKKVQANQAAGNARRARHTQQIRLALNYLTETGYLTSRSMQATLLRLGYITPKLNLTKKGRSRAA